ncbi:MAG: DUF1800 domain-containing protein [Vicinamibacteria bacterium]|nr:DUF1800 domain-containing protein [Vicinamibacteria bacterium]
MNSPRHRAWRRALATALIVASAAPAAPAAPAEIPAAARDRAAHALSRLSFGSRPGEVDQVAREGVDAWIARQLDPQRIDDSGLEARLRGLSTWGLSTAELLAGWELPPEARRELRQKGEGGGAERSRREVVRAYADQMKGQPRDVADELQQAKLLRAVYAERQLEEVLVDFWFNHFNVFSGKRPVSFLIAEYEREVIRRHLWGRFGDLLRATAQSPAMLVYLDNALSVDPEAAKRLREPMGSGRRRGGRGFGRNGNSGAARGQADAATAERRLIANRRTGLNENYARELLELHTLGVDGGYSQRDVFAVARVFTGWTVAGLVDKQPRFAFDAKLHDAKPKTVLGERVPGAGLDEGLHVLARLAAHPATARHLATKLARRLVADEPPAALVERAAATFTRTGGDLRAVVRSIVEAPEFWSEDLRRAKVKTPLEFVASALRATRAEVRSARDVVRRLGEMGMTLYGCQPPTGYADTADAWVSTSGLLARLNFALDLTAGTLPGVTIRLRQLGSERGGEPTREALVARLLPGPVSASTRATLDAGDDLSPARVAGLALGAPEFQRR